jgi:hypothetical protein
LLFEAHFVINIISDLARSKAQHELNNQSLSLSNRLEFALCDNAKFGGIFYLEAQSNRLEFALCDNAKFGGIFYLEAHASHP